MMRLARIALRRLRTQPRRSLLGASTYVVLGAVVSAVLFWPGGLMREYEALLDASATAHLGAALVSGPRGDTVPAHVDGSLLEESRELHEFGIAMWLADELGVVTGDAIEIRNIDGTSLRGPVGAILPHPQSSQVLPDLVHIEGLGDDTIHIEGRRPDDGELRRDIAAFTAPIRGIMAGIILPVAVIAFVVAAGATVLDMRNSAPDMELLSELGFSRAAIAFVIAAGQFILAAFGVVLGTVGVILIARAFPGALAMPPVMEQIGFDRAVFALSIPRIHLSAMLLFTFLIAFVAAVGAIATRSFITKPRRTP